jgi:hypothetical protein
MDTQIMTILGLAMSLPEYLLIWRGIWCLFNRILRQHTKKRSKYHQIPHQIPHFCMLSC